MPEDDNEAHCMGWHEYYVCASTITISWSEYSFPSSHFTSSYGLLTSPSSFLPSVPKHICVSDRNPSLWWLHWRTIDAEVVACSVDSKYTHYAWINTPREEGGLKGLKIPLLSDLTKQIAKDYGVLLEDEGISLRSVKPLIENTLNRRHIDSY